MDQPDSSAPPPGIRWGVENHYRMLGSLVVVQSEQADVGRAVHRLLAPFACPAGTEVAHRYVLRSSGLYRDAELLVSTDSGPELLDWLLSDLNRVAVEGFHGLAVHAGAVARGDVVMAFPGPSGAGKSTLTAACLAQGLQYVSDEALCVDFDSRGVLPYPKPLKLSRRSAALAGLACSDFVPDVLAVVPEDFGASVATAPLRLGHMVHLVRRTGPPTLHPLDRSTTVATLLAMSFNHYRNPLACFWLASRLGIEADAWRLEYDDPAPAASRLKELLEHETRAQVRP